MKLAVRKSEYLPDWYIIERAEHDGREWLEPTHYGSAFMTSARFSDADVEGTGAELLELAQAIEKREACYHKRCAVRFVGEKAEFWSPRNSQRHGEVSIEDADDLARQIKSSVSEERSHED